jgi:serine/threonine protein kinase
MSAENEEARTLKPSFLPLENLREQYVGKAVNVKLPKLKPKRLKNPVGVHGYECRSLLGKTGISATLLCVDEDGVSHVLKIPASYYDWKVHGEPVGRASMYGVIGKEVKALEAVAGLNHPCVVKFERFLEASGDDPPALVFEFCEGGSLADLLQEQGKLDPATAVRIIVQIADALAAIHELGYAHGDVKPENILFSRDRIPRLADFNSARAIAATSRSEAPLTYGYAAPEQLASRRPSQKGDVWSLALVLYEAATGRSLFPLDDVGYQEAVARLERGGSVEIRTGDGDLDAIIEKCIRANPDERPSMRELEEMLFAYLEKKTGRRGLTMRDAYEFVRLHWALSSALERLAPKLEPFFSLEALSDAPAALEMMRKALGGSRRAFLKGEVSDALRKLQPTAGILEELLVRWRGALEAEKARLEGEVSKYREYLAKLEQLREQRGMSHSTYAKLKSDYESKLRSAESTLAALNETLRIFEQVLQSLGEAA